MNKLKQYNYSSARKSIIAAIIMYFIVIALFFAVMITTAILGKRLDNSIPTLQQRSILIHYSPIYTSLFAVTGIFGLLLLIFYILSIIQTFKARVHDILLIVGIFVPVIGLIALFIKLVYINKKIAELKFSEIESLETAK